MSLSVVCLSVCLSVGRSVGLSIDNDHMFWKNGRLDRDAVWGGGSGGPKERYIRRGPEPRGRGKFWGNRWRNLRYTGASLKLLTASLEFFPSLDESESLLRSVQGSHTQLR